MSQVVQLQVSGQNHELTVKEYRGQRVVTFKDIDQLHQRPEGTAKRNFRQNRKHFIEGEDYFFVKPEDIQKDEIRPSEINNRGTILITESGYLMLVKSFTDDLAWEVQRQLVNVYFRAKQQASDYEHKLLQVEMEKIRVAKSQLLMQISEKFPNLSPESKQLLAAEAVKELTGKAMLPAPTIEVPGLSAEEMGKRFGISPQLVGRIANRFNLKTAENGRWVLSKARHNDSQRDTFVYHDTPEVMERFRQCLEQYLAERNQKGR